MPPPDAKTLSAVRPPPHRSARQASLVYASDEEPGIRRKGSKERFAYVSPTGRELRDRQTLDRIRALAIPPAWSDVWISPDPDGHLQATGRDQRGRARRAGTAGSATFPVSRQRRRAPCRQLVGS